jgi:hypothetical protein
MCRVSATRLLIYKSTEMFYNSALVTGTYVSWKINKSLNN